MKVLGLLATLQLVYGEDWWVTAAPSSYQCALDFVPDGLLNRASAYQQAFINALTKESPDYWGNLYGGASYTSQCLSTSPTSTADTGATTTIKGSSTAKFTIAQAPGPVVDNSTTTLTRTQEVTRTFRPTSSSSPISYTSTETITITKYYDETTTISPSLTVETDSSPNSAKPSSETPSITTLTLTFFTRTPLPDTRIYTTYWTNTTHLATSTYYNTSALTTGPGPVVSGNASAVTTVVGPQLTTGSLTFYNTTKSATITTTVPATVGPERTSVDPTSFVTVTYTVVEGSTLVAPSKPASTTGVVATPTPLNAAAVNTNLPTGAWDTEFGSNPFGSNPFGSNPFGSDPFGSSEKRDAPALASTSWLSISV